MCKYKFSGHTNGNIFQTNLSKEKYFFSNFVNNHNLKITQSMRTPTGTSFLDTHVGIIYFKTNFSNKTFVFKFYRYQSQPYDCPNPSLQISAGHWTILLGKFEVLTGKC